MRESNLPLPAGPLVPREAFIGLQEGVSHLCCGGEAPVPAAALAVLAVYAADKASGAAGRKRLEAQAEATRLALGHRLGLPHASRRLGFAASVSHAIDLVSRALMVRGGEVLLLDDEFPSLPLAFDARRAEGGTVRFVPSGEGCEERLVAAIGPSTRVMCVSHVSYLTGRRVDLAPLATACRAAGVALVVDVSHSAGVIPLPVEACDVIVSCAHKFLLGVHGVGLLYWNEEHLGPCPIVAPGWNSVSRYHVDQGALDWSPRSQVSAIEAGNLNFAPLYALGTALAFVEPLPLSTVADHALDLADRLKAQLAAAGVPLWTPTKRERAGSSVAVPCADAGEVAARLAAQGILVAASNGRLRLSFHLHNEPGDADRAAVAVVAALS